MDQNIRRTLIHLPFRFFALVGRDPWGYPVFEVNRRDKKSSRRYPLTGYHGLIVTWADYPVWQMTKTGLGIGRLWIDWSSGA